MTRATHHRWIVAAALAAISSSAAGAMALPPLPLGEALALALRNHETFGITREAIYQARLARTKAINYMLPTIRVEGTFSIFDREIGVPLSPAAPPLVVQRKNSFAGTGTVNLTLFDPRTWSGLSQSKVSIQVAEASVAFTRAEFLFEVARAYLSVLAAERLVQIQKNNLQLARKQEQIAKDRRKGGEGLVTMVVRAGIQVSRAVRAVTEAHKAHQMAWTVLRNLIGARRQFRLTRPLVPRPNLTEAAMAAEALRSRRDIKAATHEIEFARKAIDTTRASLYPNLSVTAIGRADQNTGFTGKILNSQTVFRMGWNIFGGGLRYTELKEKHSQLRQARLRLRLLERNVRREIRLALLELAASKSLLETVAGELKLARRNYELIMGRYRGGLATTVEVVDAQNALANAAVAVLGQELKRDTNRINLLRALGQDPITALAGAPLTVRPADAATESTGAGKEAR